MLNCAAMLLAGAMVVGQAEAASPGEEMLKRFAKDFVGEWVLVDSTDPETDLEGAKEEAHLDWVFENTSLGMTWKRSRDGVIEVQTKSLIAWDGSSKLLREFGVASAVGFGEMTYELEDGKWIKNGKVVLADGTVLKSKDTIEVTDGGNTHVHNLRNRVDEQGNPKPDAVITWKRVK